MDVVATIEKTGKTVLVDDRLDQSVGSKLADAELMGMPMRIVVSPKTLDQHMVEVMYRTTGKVEMVAIEKIASMM